MYRIRCAEIWGGIGNKDEDVCSAGIVASLYAKAHEGATGGDIHYLSVCEQDSLTRVAIADVAGHGSQVSDISQGLYEVLEARMNDPRCDHILAELNRSSVQRGIRAFTTAAVVGFYTADSNLYFAYAGHGPVLLRRHGTQTWHPISLDEEATRYANAPLGVFPDTRFDQQKMPLARGDRLFLYTDGVTEATNAQGEMFGEDRLLGVLGESGHASLPELKYAVLDATAEHTGDAKAHDDVTLLAVEVR